MNSFAVGILTFNPSVFVCAYLDLPTEVNKRTVDNMVAKCLMKANDNEESTQRNEAHSRFVPGANYGMNEGTRRDFAHNLCHAFDTFQMTNTQPPTWHR